jgi:hypothetical protein
MSRVTVILGLGAVLGCLPALATAAPATIRGEVVAATGRWTSDGSRIVTDARIRARDGREVEVSQLGGRADGIAMIQIPGSAPLAIGDRVTVTAHPASTARGRSVMVVDSAVRDSPPSFVRTGPTQGGHFLFWASSCVEITYADEGTTHVAGDLEMTALDRSLAAWTDVDCSYLTLVATGRRADTEVGSDRTNLVKFREDRWCRPAVDDDPERCHPSTAAGITTLAFVDDPGSDRDGEIIDADVEINGVDFAISVDGESLDGNDCRADLGNTMTHELGHVVGLAHTCLLPGQPARVDNAGAPVPACTEADRTAPNRLTEATMYAAQSCGETKKQTLDVDDTDALCTGYPSASDPGVCEPPASTEAGCCSASAGSRATSLLAAAFVMGWLLRRRPRR